MSELKSNKNKAKGSAYERKVSKELSRWIFDDEHMLKREPSSGAQKNSYTGDIFPYKQLPDPWKRWYLHIETKSGYAEHTPTFHKYAKVQDWFSKSYTESKAHNQNIILLICQFKNKSALFITNHAIPNVLFNVAFPVKTDDGIIYAYVYILKEVLKLNFYDCFNIGE